jgi:hypothetical protein
MSQSFSIGVLAGCAILNLGNRGSSAVSMEAALILESAFQVVQSVEKSVALFGDKALAISKLYALAAECSEQGWDGEDADPISEAAVANVEDLIRALPEGIPMPEFAPEPDGAVSVDWMHSRHRFLSLSVGSSNRLPYAWIDGSDKGHQVSYFDGKNIPPRLLSEIKAAIHNSEASDASLRAA